MDTNSVSNSNCSSAERPAEGNSPRFAPPVRSEQLPTGKKLTKDLVLSKSKGGSLVEIKKIVVWGQKITDCSIVTEIPELEVASMNANKISSLEHFGQCPNLRELFLRSNCIEDIHEIYYLKDLPNLQILWLAGNPCTKHTKYRATVIRNLEQLQKLDDTEITSPERTTSEADGLLFDNPPIRAVKAVSAPKQTPAGDLEECIRPAEDMPVIPSSADAAPAQPAAMEPPRQQQQVEAAVEKQTAAEKPTVAGLEAPSSVPATLPLTASRPLGAASQPGAPLPRYAMTEVRTAVLRLIRLLDQESLQLVLHTVRSRLDTEPPPDGEQQKQETPQDAGDGHDISTAFSMENL